MPKGIYKRKNNNKKRSDRLPRETRECLGKCGLKKEAKIISSWRRCRECYEKTMIGGTNFHKSDCKCLPCCAKRKELIGSSNPMFGKTTSDYQKLRASETNINKIRSKESLEKGVETRRKKGSYNYSKETIEKQKDTKRQNAEKRGYWYSEEVKLKLKGKGRIKRINRFCQCGCGLTFECKPKDSKMYFQGHSNRVRKISEETKRKRRFIRIPREIRICLCGCLETFICKFASTQKYISGHHRRGKHLTLEQRIKLKRPKSEKALAKMLHSVCQRPNKFEIKGMKYLELIYPTKFKYTGNGTMIVNHRSADAFAKDLNTIVLFNGCYWHLKRKGYEITEKNKRIIEHFEAQPFLDAGYKVIFIWEDEIEKLLNNTNHNLIYENTCS